MLVAHEQRYARLCHCFAVEDAATRANMRATVVPHLARLRRDLTGALWRDRQSRWPVARADRRAMRAEVAELRAALRAARTRLAQYPI